MTRGAFKLNRNIIASPIYGCVRAEIHMKVSWGFDDELLTSPHGATQAVIVVEVEVFYEVVVLVMTKDGSK